MIGWEAFALAVLGWTTVPLFDLSGRALPVLAAGLAAAWLLGAWRIARMGVYLGDDGVRIRGLFRSRTLRWHDIAKIWLHRSSHRFGRWEIPSGMTVLMERRDGSLVNTELWAQGVDFHARPKAFRAVYEQLRDRHFAATRRLSRPAAA